LVPVASIGPAAVFKPNLGLTANAVFTVFLSFPSVQDVTVQYVTVVTATATAGKDFQQTSGTLTIHAGQTTGQISVPVLGDNTLDGNKTFLVQLSSPAGAALGTATGTGTIVDDRGSESVVVSDGILRE